MRRVQLSKRVNKRNFRKATRKINRKNLIRYVPRGGISL